LAASSSFRPGNRQKYMGSGGVTVFTTLDLMTGITAAIP
jgi:hypothetical protein